MKCTVTMTMTMTMTMDRYIHESSNLQINISSKDRKKLENNFVFIEKWLNQHNNNCNDIYDDDGTLEKMYTFFDIPIKHVLRLLRGSFRRFSETQVRLYSSLISDFEIGNLHAMFD